VTRITKEDAMTVVSHINQTWPDAFVDIGQKSSDARSSGTH
jgi:hypothetical protein